MASLWGNTQSRLQQRAQNSPQFRMYGDIMADATGSLTGSPVFQAGNTALLQGLQGQAIGDAARTAASGLRGGEMDVALAGQRGQILAGGQQQLLGQAQNQQNYARGLMHSRFAQQDHMEEQQRQRRNSLWGTLGGVAGGLLGGPLGGMLGAGLGSAIGKPQYGAQDFKNKFLR